MITKIVKVTGAIVQNEDKWIYDWFEMDSTCANDVEKALIEANGEDVTIQINSPGGDIGAGNEIAYHISQYKGKTTADIMGYCCSAATLPACAANKSRMSPSALFMIHNVSGGDNGDYRDLAHTSDVLKTASEAISKTYQQKTGMSESELLKMMDEETWLNATQAKEKGFVDEIIGETKTMSLYNAAPNVMLSDEVKNKIRNQIKNPNSNDADLDFLLQKNQALANLNLLKLKGEQ